MHPSINKLRLARLQRGIYQRELSERTGIQATYLSLFETGKVRPTVDQANRIAAVLGVEVGELLEEVSVPALSCPQPAEGGSK